MSHRVLSFALLLAACSARSTPHPDGGGVAGLHVVPADTNQTMQISGAAPTPIVFHAFEGDVDVTSDVTWSSDPSPVGTIGATGTLVPAAGGKTVVHATRGDAVADGNVTIQVVGDAYGPGATDTMSLVFSNGTSDANPGNAPVLEYPEDGTVLPANIPSPQMQWSQVADNDTYRVHFVSADVLDVYLYGAGRAITADAVAWALLARTVADRSTTWTVESGGPSGKLRTSAPRSFTITSDTIDQSAIYVWQPSSGTFHILDMAKGKDIPLPTSEPKLQPGQPCSGCHRISRDGKRFGYTFDATFQLGSMTFDDASMQFVPKIAPTSAAVGTYVAFDPNEAMNRPAMLTTVPDIVAQNTAGTVRLRMLDADTAAPLASDLAAMIAALPASVGHATLMPDWAPDGSFVVFSAYDSDKNFVRDLGDDSVLSSVVEVPVQFDGAMYHFGTPKPLVVTADSNPDTGENNVLPAISPDASAVAYTRAAGWWSIKNQVSMVNLSGEIRVVRRADGHVFTLDKGSRGSSTLTNNSWPQWAPTVGKKYTWIAYGSERPYGHLVTPANHSCGSLVQGQQSCKQLWVTAIDRDKLANGTDDPSAAPFWIPGQSIDEQYVSPQWTTSVISIQ